jgi:hypothetical protein
MPIYSPVRQACCEDIFNGQLPGGQSLLKRVPRKALKGADRFC